MERALIIDDDQLIHYAVSKAIHPYYPEVKAVSNGADALRELSSCFYALCFLDIGLQEAHGLPLLNEIRTKSPNTRVVIMTGSALDESVKNAIEESSYCFLSKPFDIAELKEIARQALGKTGEGPYEVSGSSAVSTLNKTVHYTITVLELGKPMSLNLRGDITDISESGLSLTTYYPLEPGHLLVFTSGIEESEYRTGIVKWSMLTDDSYMYRAGIEFTKP
jgi:CheY-like chemotaxis protein